jgi:hypothetical protein
MPTATLTSPKLTVTLNVAETLQQSVYMRDRIKVELWYETDKPKHLSSLLLASTFGFEGDFVESISVLLKADKVYDMAEAYWDTLEFLKDNGYVPNDAELFGYEIRLEDKQTLAWVM